MMEEWAALKELEDLAELERREARTFTWDNARRWMLATMWGLLAAAALGFGAAYATLAGETHFGALGALTFVLAMLVVLPLVAGTVLLLWVGFFAVFPKFARARVQITVFLVLCGMAMILAWSGSPDAVRARRLHAEQKREMQRAQRDPKASAPREGERSEGVLAQGSAAAPALPEIVIERPNGGVRLTNNSARALTIAAVLQPELGQVKNWTGRPIAECAPLTGPRGETPAPPIVLRPGEEGTFTRQASCAGLETAPVQLTVVDEQKQPVLYTLKFRR
jgi:hypothetical protein